MCVLEVVCGLADIRYECVMLKCLLYTFVLIQMCA